MPSTRWLPYFSANGITSALVSGGGSSIYGIPARRLPGFAGLCSFEFATLKTRRRRLAEVYLKDDSSSTSGNYEKLLSRGESRLYSHINESRRRVIQPRARCPVSSCFTQTLDSEVWAKPYAHPGRTWTEAHKPKGLPGALLR